MATNPNSLMVFNPQRSASMGRGVRLPEQYGFRPRAGASPMAATALPKIPKTVDELIYSAPSDAGQYGGVGEGEGLGVGPGGSTGKGGADLGTVASALGPAILGGNPIGLGLNMGALALSGGKHGFASGLYALGKQGLQGLGLLGRGGTGESNGGLLGSHGIVGVGPGGEIGQTSADAADSGEGQIGMSLGEGDFGIGQTAVGDDGGLGLAGIGVGGADSGVGGAAGGVAGDGGGFGYGVGGGGIW